MSARVEAVILRFPERPVAGPWTDDAACREADPTLFFAREGDDKRKHDARVKEALEFCRVCPVRTECLDYAHASRERFGIWGGDEFGDGRYLSRRSHH